MSDIPLVSIIIPCFNASDYVRGAIESALAQTHPHCEIIVVDDGSTDNSPEILKSFGDLIRVVATANQGGGAARNTGLLAAHGEFVQFLDADDVLYPDKILRQLADAMPSRATLVFCDAETIDEPTSHSDHVRTDDSTDAVIFMLNGGLQTSAPLHRKSWLQAVGGFREDLSCSQERDLHLRIAAAGISFQRLPEVLYGVRRVAGSVSSNVAKVLLQHRRIVEPVFELLANRGELNNRRRRAFAALIARDARLLYRAGFREESREYFRLAAQFDRCGGLDSAFSRPSSAFARLFGPIFAMKTQEFTMNLCSLVGYGYSRPK